ncbi:unnamed protein product [Adineta steineri]|uniref:Uncharacterized protein n=1 Tax=Adineta steineri TaxID=433720 RepID=A0A813MMA4_9BILA|nr:unnamed protein product [Adineta steineri]CAF1380424.1 unnamed protein product [Adineta steineri]
MPLIVNEVPHDHCSNVSREKFFQIWSHKAANISNDLIEYTIRRMQSDRLRFLFQTRNKLTEEEHIVPICQLSLHTEDDLQRIKEYIRRFCLTTRNVYRHLRSDSRIYPKMSIDLDQGIMIKICRFIFKTKVLIQILLKQQHLSEQQHEQLKKYKIKQFEFNDPYKNITKAFIVLQSNFQILFGDILDKDFFQNAKTAVQTLPILLDTSKTIRLIFCTLYKLSEPERQAEAEAIRQRRLQICSRGYGTKKQGIISSNIPIKNEGHQNLKTTSEIFKNVQPQTTQTSTSKPTKTQLSPSKTISNTKSKDHQKTKTTESSKKLRSSKSQQNSPNTTTSDTSKHRPVPSSPTLKRKNDSPKKTSTKQQKKTKHTTVKQTNEKKSKNKNQNTSTTTTYSTSSLQYNENTDPIQLLSREKFSCTTWLDNLTLNLPTEINNNTNSSKPLLTTWASLNRISNNM